MLHALQGLIAWTPLGLPAFLFVITIVVFFHEMGHFLVARFFGVKVDVFSVGFGREIVGLTDRHGTRWKISWIPFGGYVKFAGDADAASTPDRAATARMSSAEREGVLAFKPLYQRALVSVAGPLANFVLAIVLLTGLNLFTGHNVLAPIIGGVTKGSAAEAAGIKPGDRVTAVDGAPITDFYQLSEIVSVSGGRDLAIALERVGKPLTLHVSPRIMRARDALGDMGNSVLIGVYASATAPWTHLSYGPAGAFGAACTETWDIMRATIEGIVQMVRGYASPDQFRGPLGIAKITRQVAVLGFLALLNLAAVLSVSIGLANLFPIPLLDGGHLLYYGCEAVLGRPLGERAQDVGFRLGLVLVLGLMLLTTWNDLVRLIFSETSAAAGLAGARPKDECRDGGMRTIALNKAFLRATSATLVLGLFACPAAAQVSPVAPGAAVPNNAAAAAAANPAAAPAAAPAAPQHIIQHIVVAGTQRVEPDTVLTYISEREGDPYDTATNDAALKALTATGLFSSVATGFDDATSTLTIRVVENPIVNVVNFEGNSKVSDKDLTKEVQLKARSIFTRAKVQADVQRILEVYRRNGKFAARVDPEIIQRPQNRVDVIFSISDGPTTGIARINFIGNKIYDDDTLKAQIATEESRWWKFLSSNDNYDADRLAFDREKLTQFYRNHGYADFAVTSAVAQLAPDRRNFYLNFTVSEGIKYQFGDITINSKIKELTAAILRPSIPITKGDTYDADLVEKSIDALTNAAGEKGYAFAQVHPRISRDAKTHTINMAFDIDQGPRVYIEKINIVGNAQTLDKVIRREFRLVEGDAFNQVLVDRSRTRIRGLGFFKEVEVKPSPGSQPDRTDLTVTVTEQSTGSIQLGLGYSSTSNLVGEFTYTQLNLFGRGQNLNASVQISQVAKNYQFDFTEPWFLDRNLSAGFDLVDNSTDYQQETFASDTIGATLRLGFPVSEFSAVGLSYSYQIGDILPFANAPLEIQLAAGHTYGSILGYSYNFSNLDDARPGFTTKGVNFNFAQTFAGFGGNLRYVKEAATFAVFHPILDDAVITSLGFNAGYISGYDGTAVPVGQRFFEGADTFPGFAVAGVGPRDTAQPLNTGAGGGNVYAVGSLKARLPQFLPQSYGVGTGLFTYFGTDGRVDNVIRACAPSTCVKDNLAFRMSAGVSIDWRSPFGPLHIDLGLPIVKAPYDRPQIIHFGAQTGF